MAVSTRQVRLLPRSRADQPPRATRHDWTPPRRARVGTTCRVRLQRVAWRVPPPIRARPTRLTPRMDHGQAPATAPTGRVQTATAGRMGRRRTQPRTGRLRPTAISATVQRRTRLYLGQRRQTSRVGSQQHHRSIPLHPRVSHPDRRNRRMASLSTVRARRFPRRVRRQDTRRRTPPPRATAAVLSTDTRAEAVVAATAPPRLTVPVAVPGRHRPRPTSATAVTDQARLTRAAATHRARRPPAIARVRILRRVFRARLAFTTHPAAARRMLEAAVVVDQSPRWAAVRLPILRWQSSPFRSFPYANW